MRKETADRIALALWAVGLVPVSLLMQWLGAVAPGWGGFITAYVVVAVITLTFELFQRWIQRLLRARAGDKSPSSPEP